MPIKAKRNLNTKPVSAKAEKSVTVELPQVEFTRHINNAYVGGKQDGARNVLTYLVHKDYISVGAAITAALNGFEAETDSEANPF